MLTFETISHAMMGSGERPLPRYLYRKSDPPNGYPELFTAMVDSFERLNCLLEGANSQGYPLESNEDLDRLYYTYSEIQEILCRAAFESGRAVGAGRLGQGFPTDEDEGFDLVYSCILEELVSVPSCLEPILEFVPTKEYEELYEKVYNARLSIGRELSSGDEPRICFDLVDHIERCHRVLCREIYTYGIRLERKRAYQRNKKRRKKAL